MPVTIRPTVDVIVVGAGTAGAIAAIAAARTGAKTLVVDQYGQIGGMASTGMSLVGVLDGEGFPALGGIGRALLDRLEQIGGATPPLLHPSLGSTTEVDPELLKHVLIDMYTHAGGGFLLHSFLADVVMSGSRVSGIIVENKSGRQIVLASVVVDCSGDADVAARAGAPLTKGRSEDGRMQPTTQIFRLMNVETERVIRYLEEHPEEMSLPEGWQHGTGMTAELLRRPGVTVNAFYSLVRKARDAGEWTLGRDFIDINFLPGRGEVTVNATRVQDIDGTNVDDLTRAEIETKRQILEILSFVRKYVPGFERAHIMSVPFQVGVRETRHVLGDYVMTAEDILAGSDFEDTVARGAYPLDIHDIGAKTKAYGHEAKGSGHTLWKLDRSYGIPLRCLVPQKIDNLLVAGRSISATHEAAASVRGMAVCMATGHAAGTAAALASMSGITPRALDVPSLQAKLREQDAVLLRGEGLVLTRK